MAGHAGFDSRTPLMTDKQIASRAHWVARLTRAPAYRWPDRGGPVARLRRWVLHTVMRYGDESCDACGRAVRLPWQTDDHALWATVYERAMGYPPVERCNEWRGGLLCTRCFDAASPARLLWRPGPPDCPDSEPL